MKNLLRSGRYLNPFVDFGFKKLFGTEVNKAFLIDFLNQVIKEEGCIKDLQYLKTEHLGETINERKAIFDIYCENEKGEKFIVEMQKVRQQYFKDRSIFYATFPIREQSSQKDWNFKLKAIYTICILDFEFPENKEDDSFYSKVKLMDVEKKVVFYDKLTFIYLEMPKFRKEETDLYSMYDKWLYVLKNLSVLNNRPKELREKIFEDFFRAAEVAQLTTKEMDKYEEDLKNYRDLKNSLDTAKEEGFEMGREEGREVGLKEGLEEGLKEGLKEGREEGLKKGLEQGLEQGLKQGVEQEKKNIVMNCFQQGFSIEDISKITELTVDQINLLIQNKD